MSSLEERAKELVTALIDSLEVDISLADETAAVALPGAVKLLLAFAQSVRAEALREAARAALAIPEHRPLNHISDDYCAGHHDASRAVNLLFDTPRSAPINPTVIAWKVVREVAELPDRTSPDDQPSMMLVTAQELHDLIVAQLAALSIAEGRDG